MRVAIVAEITYTSESVLFKNKNKAVKRNTKIKPKRVTVQNIEENLRKQTTRTNTNVRVESS